ncbi:hypothetical protein HYV31_04170 [candidate division WWE3 bacterium]|nr:hypothetical protein [candidate division WWE3 bacterium]
MIKLKLPKLNISKEAVCKGSFYLTLTLFLISLVLQIVITNKYSIKGAELATLKEQEIVYVREISALKLAISETSSLAEVERKAIALGLVEYTSPIASITSSQFAAAR